MSSYFYLQAEKDNKNAELLASLEKYAEENKVLVYVLGRPLTDPKYNYDYTDALIVLSPKKKILIINCGSDDGAFDNFVEDVIEDIGSISDKFLYKDVVGRPREWRQNLLEYGAKIDQIGSIQDLFNQTTLTDEFEKKKLELLISLFIGSINDVERVKDDIPQTTLDKVKQKIQLFDADQTRFIYKKLDQQKITIQGLSGTGKTELLLHKLKDLYVGDSSSSIFFTCHNKILADSLRKRIPSFFNFMKVEQQIEWNARLWCANAWGSNSYAHSGAYRFMTYFYGIPFHRYSPQVSFSMVCKIAIEDITNKYGVGKIPPAFTYMFIDESQDFDENFFKLCELVTEKNLYIAGDIFQSIFDSTISSIIEPDFLLGKCYRTDPKTLMFAHGLGMGLFEKKKLRWLEAKEWRDCGYKVKVEDNKYYLSREPLRRFEDLDDTFESIRIIDAGDSFSDTVVELIKGIKTENNTVLPDDIGIIMLDQNKQIYELADILEYKIQQAFGWAVNKAYETKERRPNTLLISNRNNVKGLEFPFVICLTTSIKSSPSYRNSLYTMLTRSFIESFLVIPNTPGSGLTDSMKSALERIIKENQMVVEEPSTEEKTEIQTNFEYQLQARSLFDVMTDIFKRLKIDDSQTQEKFFDLAKVMGLEESDEETLLQFVQENLKFI